MSAGTLSIKITCALWKDARRDITARNSSPITLRSTRSSLRNKAKTCLRNKRLNNVWRSFRKPELKWRSWMALRIQKLNPLKHHRIALRVQKSIPLKHSWETISTPTLMWDKVNHLIIGKICIMLNKGP